MLRRGDGVSFRREAWQIQRRGEPEINGAPHSRLVRQYDPSTGSFADKQGDCATATTEQEQRMNRRQFSLAGIATLALAAFGCKTVSAVFNQSTLAALVNEVGSGVVSLLNYLGKSSIATQVASYITAAVNAINGWTPGTGASGLAGYLFAICCGAEMEYI
jgi:hypothetical protein